MIDNLVCSITISGLNLIDVAMSVDNLVNLGVPLVLEFGSSFGVAAGQNSHQLLAHQALLVCNSQTAASEG